MRGILGRRRALGVALASALISSAGTVRADAPPTFEEHDLTVGAGSTAPAAAAPSEEGWEATPRPPADETGTHPAGSPHDGAAGAVQDSLDEAGDKAGVGLEKAGAATGRAIDKAITRTGEGVGYVVDKTGEGLRKAGEALSGEGK